LVTILSGGGKITALQNVRHIGIPLGFVSLLGRRKM
jgi:hypothetical protein